MLVCPWCGGDQFHRDPNGDLFCDKCRVSMGTCGPNGTVYYDERIKEEDYHG